MEFAVSAMSPLCATSRAYAFPVPKPAAIVFDVNETLFSLDALDPVFDEYGLTGMRDLWFARTLRTGFALTAMDGYRTFPEVATTEFQLLAPERIDARGMDSLLQAFASLQAHRDVAPALQRLHESGVPMVTLSVGSASNVEKLFHSAGLSDLIEHHLSCEAVQRWKPAPEPYRFACRFLDCEPKDVAMVAAHSWDIAGAAAAGMKTAWISRLEGVFDASFYSADFPGPELSGVDLLDIVERLLS
ncbi:MAG: hypothetical protein RLZZ163_71 [Actinomycetota bacterium]